MNDIYKLKYLTTTKVNYKNQDIVITNYYTKKGTCVSWVILFPNKTTFVDWTIRQKGQKMSSSIPSIKRALAKTKLFKSEEELIDFIYDKVWPNFIPLYPTIEVEPYSELF